MNIDFKFFKKEIEEEGLEILGAEEIKDPPPNKSGSYSLDFDLVVPFPGGRIIEIFGDESTCKTTLGLSIIGQAIKNGKIGLYINAEKNLNLSLMRSVRTLRPYIDDAIKQMESGKNSHCPLWIVEPSNGEQAFEAVRKFASMVPNGVVVLDSIDACQPSAVLAGEIGENKVGNLAKLISDAMRKLVTVVKSNNVCVIFINQLRDKITMYGDPSDVPGGRALKYYASQRIRLMKPRKVDFITDGDGERIGVIIRYLIVKNKLAPDGNEGSFPVLYKNGIFSEQELIAQCCSFGVLRMGGKGGKQVYLPKIDRDTGEYIIENNERSEMCMSQFNAARRLLIDTTLTQKLHNDLLSILKPGSIDPMDKLTNEIQDAE